MLMGHNVPGTWFKFISVNFCSEQMQHKNGKRWHDISLSNRHIALYLDFNNGKFFMVWFIEEKIQKVGQNCLNPGEEERWVLLA